MKLFKLLASTGAALIGAFIGNALAHASAGAAPLSSAQPPSEILSQYTRAHDLFDVGGGRKMNLFCMGTGPRTVIFDAGGSDWSAIWALVQPAVSAQTKACTYDRAGLGYSEPSRKPRSPMAIAEDLHALIRAAKLTAPVILVGHSLGGFNMKLYAALYPDDVAGLVLIDPAEERLFDRTRDFARAKFGASLAARAELGDLTWMTAAIARFEKCVAAAQAQDLDPASPIYKSCSDPVRAPLGPEIAAERQKIQVKRAYQEAQASELANSVYADARGDNAYAALFSPHVFGDKPLTVLVHGNHDATNELEAISYATNIELHSQTAALSRRGRVQIVPNAGHNVQIDAPAAVIDAVNTILRELDQKRPG